MRILQKLLKKQSAAPGIVAVSFLSNGIAIAVTRYAEQTQPRLLHCEFMQATGQQVQAQLALLVKQHGLEEYDCHILLNSEQYHLMTIETPAVNSEEIKQAIRWRIADLLDFPVEQAAIDFFPLPKSNRANSTPMLEVVVGANQVLSTLTQHCRQAGLNVKVIDIQETALRNLAAFLRESPQGTALLHLQKEGGRIIIQKSGEIYLSRKIVTGYLQLDGATPLYDQEQLSLEQDNLILEIQRSIDYVENYFDTPPITCLAMVLMPINSQNIINVLNINHSITTLAMDLSAIVESDTLLDDATQNICAPVIGASLRRVMEKDAS